MIKTDASFQLKSAEILTVGTELLLGQIVNTNAHFLARELSLLGLNSYYQTVVGDNPERLAAALRLAVSRSDCVIITGGLGPTQDDISMKTAAEVCGLPLKLDETSLSRIESYFTTRGRRMAPANRKQALFPPDAQILPNNNGTAPGAAFMYQKEGRSALLILLPGPPDEIVPMFTESAAPLLQKFSAEALENIFIKTIGIGESDLAEILSDLLAEEQVNPSLAPYAGIGEVSLRLSYKHAKTEKQALENAAVRAMLSEIQAKLGDYIYEIGERNLTEVTGELILAEHKSVAFAESCTAGLAAATLAQVPGISAALRGAMVCYQNEIKEKVLGVPAALLARSGAVSADCARVMAERVRSIFDADIGISVTGNAGPAGSENKPAGLVYIAAADEAGCRVKEFRFGGNREKVRTLAAKQAINALRRSLLPSVTGP